MYCTHSGYGGYGSNTAGGYGGAGGYGTGAYGSSYGGGGYGGYGGSYGGGYGGGYGGYGGGYGMGMGMGMGMGYGQNLIPPWLEKLHQTVVSVGMIIEVPSLPPLPAVLSLNLPPTAISLLFSLHRC